MKVVVLGATGATGQLVVEQALKRGFSVVAYVRNASGLAPRPGLEIIQGQLSDVALLTQAMKGADAVLVTLGPKETKHVDLMQKSLPLIIQAMKAAKVVRIVLMSAYGVGDTARTASLVARLAYKTMVASVYEDKARSEAILPTSELQWTSVLPVILSNGPASDETGVWVMSRVAKVSGLPKVSRADVAKAMLDAIGDLRAINQQLLVAPRAAVR